MLNAQYVQTAVSNAPKFTGYVPNIGDASGPQTQAFRPFEVHRETFAGATPFQKQAIARIHETTPLNASYFSPQNVQHLQNEIRYRVFLETKHTIDEQSPDDLKTVMRSYYLQYSTNDGTSTQSQVSYLNNLVLQFSVDRVIVELKAYLKYINDQQNYPLQIERPINPSIVGTRTPEFKTFF